MYHATGKSRVHFLISIGLVGAVFVLLVLSIGLLAGGCTSGTTKYVPPKVLFEDAFVARDVVKNRSSSDPKEATETFTSEDRQAVMWVKLGDIAGIHKLKWEWYDPKGRLYLTSGEYTINSDGKNRPYHTSWHAMLIKDEKAETLPGAWQAKVYLDNKLVANKSFEIKKVSPFARVISSGPKAKPDPHKWAVVIGIEKYRKTTPVQFAETDAMMAREFFVNRVGVPAKNVLTLVNETASKADIEYLLKDRLPGLVKNGDTLYFYFAGHGIPADSAPYLLPYDGDPDSPAITAYAVDALYKELDQLPAGNIVVFLDACFSGRTGREEKESTLLASARPGMLKVRDPLLLSDKIISLSAAKSNQLSNSFQEQGHGLFTYYLLKGMLGEADENGDKKISMGELSRYVEQEVASASRRIYGLARQQNPVAQPKNLEERGDIEIVGPLK